MNYYERYQTYKRRYLRAKKRVGANGNSGGHMDSDSMITNDNDDMDIDNMTIDRIYIKRTNNDGSVYYMHNVYLDKPVIINRSAIRGLTIDKSIIDEPLLDTHKITDVRINDGKLKIWLQ